MKANLKVTALQANLVWENAIQNRLIDKIVNSAFGGSASRLVLQALGNHKATQSELDEIRKLLDDLENE